MPEASAPGSATAGDADTDRGLVIAIDGPSGAGKSTVALATARRLGLRYLDTGAMYRAVTCRALDRGVAPEDGAALAELAECTVLRISTDPDAFWVTADGVDLTGEIRSRRVSAAVSAVSSVPAVRARLIAQQREVIGRGGIVVEGRDIGTVVAPQAQVKVFLTASGDARASRRARQLDGPAAGDAAVRRTRTEIDIRDRLDAGTTPLMRAADALELDSTGLSAAEVVDRVVAAAGVPR